MAGTMQNSLENQLMQAAKVIEEQVDAEIQKMDKMDEDDYEALRRQRLQNLKKAQQQKQEWLAQGHGQYEEIAEEKDFFDVCKKSNKVVCHFYRDSAFRCKIVDKHLEILARKHMETKFCKINAEKAPFLTQRLNIRIIPTICLAKDAKTKDYIKGFDDLGGHDEFSTEMLEWRIAQADVINYNGDLLTPPVTQQKKKTVFGHQKKTIRGNDDDDSSDDDY